MAQPGNGYAEALGVVTMGGVLIGVILLPAVVGLRRRVGRQDTV